MGAGSRDFIKSIAISGGTLPVVSTTDLSGKLTAGMTPVALREVIDHAIRDSHLLPPLAVFLCRKPFQAIINILLTLAFWVPGMVHALFVVHSHLDDKRTDRVIKAIKQNKGRD